VSIRWRHVRVVMWKEILDGLRDKRSLVTALLFPLFGPILVTVMFTAILEEQASQEALSLPVVGAEHAPGLVEHLEREGVIIEDAPVDPEAAVSSGEIDVVLVIPEDFAEDFRAGRPAELELVIDGSRRDSRTPIQRARRAVEAWGSTVGTLRLLARGVDPKVVQAVVVHELDTSTPQREASMFFGIVSFYVMLAIFLGGMFVATDSTAGERERRSLEPLLLNPVSRDALAIGKWLATATFSATALLITIVGAVVALERLPLENVGLSLQFEPEHGIAVLGALLPLSLAASGLQLLAASFARSFREAQSYLSFISMLLPMLPGFFLMLYPERTADWMAAVPILGQGALLSDTLRGDPTDPWLFVLAGVIALAVGVLCVWITARLFEREKIIFGG